MENSTDGGLFSEHFLGHCIHQSFTFLVITTLLFKNWFERHVDPVRQRSSTTNECNFLRWYHRWERRRRRLVHVHLGNTKERHLASNELPNRPTVSTRISEDPIRKRILQIIGLSNPSWNALEKINSFRWRRRSIRMNEMHNTFWPMRFVGEQRETSIFVWRLWSFPHLQTKALHFRSVGVD